MNRLCRRNSARLRRRRLMHQRRQRYQLDSDNELSLDDELTLDLGDHVNKLTTTQKNTVTEGINRKCRRIENETKKLVAPNSLRTISTTLIQRQKYLSRRSSIDAVRQSSRLVFHVFIQTLKALIRARHVSFISEVLPII